MKKLGIESVFGIAGLRLESSQAQTVRDDEYGAERHGSARDQRVQQPQCCERQGGHVVGEGPEQIPLDGFQRRSRESNRVRS